MTRRLLFGSLLVAMAVGCSQAPTMHPGARTAPGSFEAEVTGASAASEAEVGGIAVVGGVSAPQGTYAPHQLVVTLASDADAMRVAERAGASCDAQVRFTQRYARFLLPRESSLSEAAKRLQAVSGVLAVGFDWHLRPSYLSAGATPNDPQFASQWAHQATHMRDAWRMLGPSFTAANTAIAVLDSGCDVGHPEFAGRILGGENLTSEHPDASQSLATDLSDLIGHGTHVMGIAGAAGNDAEGVAGVAWDAKLLPVKVLAQSGGTLFDAIRGIRYAADFVSGTGAVVRVINMSLGADSIVTTDAAFEDAMRYAWNKGIVVVVAAGNTAGVVSDPAVNPHALVVSSTSHYQVGSYFTELFSGFSNRGDRIDVAAPGGEILSTTARFTNGVSTELGLRTWTIGNNRTALDPPYGAISGTSMAAPYVSGLVALLAARYDPYNNDLTASFADRVANRIRQTADDMGPPGKDPYFGYGRVNALQALAPSSL